ncbi:hypothetical protein EPN29_12915 [bacterium]|nr:MAG: hypothetical protein EPN29_12915 [bacterium]
MRSLLAAPLAALVLAACGGAATGSGAGPSPTPSVAPGPGFDLAVTERDPSATMRVGQKIEVVLHAYSGMTDWSHVASSDTSILEPTVNPAATAVRGVTLAGFKAVAPGQAEITAGAGPRCSPAQACPMYVLQVAIKVTVTA